MGQNKLPFPSPSFPKMVRGAMQNNEIAVQTLSYGYSGELTSGETGQPLGAVTEDGTLVDFVVSVENQGRDDTDDLSVGADLLLNGVSVISGEVTLEGVSGEAPSSAVGSTPTFTTTSVSRGDRLSIVLNLTRTTPDTEMKNLFATVKIVPVLE